MEGSFARVFLFCAMLFVPPTIARISTKLPSLRTILPMQPSKLSAFAAKNHRNRFKFMSVRRAMSATDSANSKRVLVPIANGSEEIETTCITDTLTRFGASVTVASANADGSLVCTMSRGIKFMADLSVAEALSSGGDDWDLVALPGGMPGAEHLRDCEPLVELLRTRSAAGSLNAAICASPAVVFGAHNLLPKGESAAATCYPAPPFRSVLGEIASESDVVVSGNIVTSKGPGTSLKFGLQLGELLYGKEAADKIAAEMLVDR